MAQRQETDIVVIGAGPVGLFQVFEAGMLDMRCHLVDALDDAGGQCRALYPDKPIYDIPGWPVIEAQGLVRQLREQASPFAPVYHLGQQATALRGQAGDFAVATSKGLEIACKAVVVAAGGGAFGPNRPPLAGIEAFERAGTVAYLVARREDCRGKRVVVAGGGDAALDWVLALHGIASSIALVHRRRRFRGAPESVKRVEALAAAGEVELVVPWQLHGLEGEGGALAAVVVADLDGRRRRLEADLLLPLYGLRMELGPIAGWGLQLEKKSVAVDAATCRTSTPGVYAVGDVATYPGKLKLILCGFSETARAAHDIYDLVHPGKPLHFEYSTTRGVPGA